MIGLRQPKRTNAGRRQTAVGASIPAPTGGWNAKDPLSEMDPKDAVILDNWIPRGGYVEVRRGSRGQATGAAHPTESLLVWRGASLGSDEIYAVAGGDIFNVSTLGSVFAGPVYTGLTNNRVQSINFANDGGAFMICANGEDTPFRYDGSSFAVLSISGSSGSITLNAASLIDVMSHKRRLFFIEAGTLRVWFLGTNAIQGPASLLDLGGVFQQGGTLQCEGTWSLDGGQGQDDYAVFVTDQGEVAIYQGTDPADDNNWSLVGVFSLGIPLGRRSLFKFGGDLQVLTSNGVIPLSQALALDRAQEDNVAVTAKIQNAFGAASQSYSRNFGWEGLTYQRGQLAIYNIPVLELTTSYQYVQNLQTGAWCRFTGIDAFCWAVANEAIYWGGVDGVYEWNQGILDNGSRLVADLKTAFNYFGRRGSLKHFTMLRPNLNATSDVSPAVEMLTDFNEREPSAVPITTIFSSDDLLIRLNWTSLAALGYCGAVRMQTVFELDPNLISDLVDGEGNTIVDGAGDTIETASAEPMNDSQIQIIAFDVLFEEGGQL